MAFQTFTHRPLSHRSGIPFVSVSPNGFIGLNAHTCAQLGNPRAVTLAWDADLGLARIAAAEPTAPGAFLTGARTPGQSLKGDAFLEHIGVPRPAETRRFPLYESGPGWVVVDLGALCAL